MVQAVRIEVEIHLKLDSAAICRQTFTRSLVRKSKLVLKFCGFILQSLRKIFRKLLYQYNNMVAPVSRSLQ